MAYGLVLYALLVLWLPLSRKAAVVVIAVSLVAALASGVISWVALIPLSVLGFLILVVRGDVDLPGGVGTQIVATAMTALLALALGLHVFPGFAQIGIFPHVQVSADAQPIRGLINTDKLIPGLMVLGLLVPCVQSWRAFMDALVRATPVIVITTVSVMLLAVAIGYVRLDIKWPAVFFPWLALNLLTCLVEEGFFRGFLQARLGDWLGPVLPHAGIVALVVSAAFFGLAHFAGGTKYVLLATVAGLGYGLVFHLTRRIEAAIAAHLVLNTSHFLMLTFPALSV